MVAGAAGAENAFARRFSSSIILQNRICVFSFLSFRHSQLGKDCGAMLYRLLNIIFESFPLTFSFPLDLGQIISTEI